MPQFRITDAAKLLGVGDDTVRRWVDGGTLPVKKVLAQVETRCGPHRVVSLMSSEPERELGREPGVPAVAVIKSTNVVVETPGGTS